MLFRKLEDAQRSIDVTLDEINQSEREFYKKNGIDIRDEWERTEAQEIIARIERKLQGRVHTNPTLKHPLSGK